MAELEKAIKRTIEYGRRFGVEYNRGDVKERLISGRVQREKEIDKELSRLSVTSCQLRVYKKNYFEKVEKAKWLAEIIGAKFPNVLFIGVTGSVAAGYPPKESDIDLMIITKENRMWLTRLLLRWWIWKQKIPHRKYGKSEKQDEFCFNLWLEENSLKIPRDRQNLKNAMDAILMKQILNKNNIYQRFLVENRWMKKWVATGYNKLITNYQLRITNSKLTPQPPLAGGQKILFNIFLGKFIDKIYDWFLMGSNWLVFWPQWWYMKRKIDGGLVEKSRAFFHPMKK